MESHVNKRHKTSMIKSTSSTAENILHGNQDAHIIKEITPSVPSFSGPSISSDPALEFQCTPCSPTKGNPLKKTKASTPVTSKAGLEIFSSPGFSPLHHKISKSKADNSYFDKNDESSSLCERKCVAVNCQNISNLKPLVRKKFRGGRCKFIDWESTELLITYFKLTNLDDLFEVLICQQHWRQWYYYNYNLKKYLIPFVENVQENSNLLVNVNIHNIEEVFNIFGLCQQINAFVILICNNLNHSDLLNLSYICHFFYKAVKKYLANDLVWKRLLSESYFVDRKLKEKSFFESFKEIACYCQERNSIKFEDDLNIQTFVVDLKKEFESQNDLTTLLKSFGEDRKPKPLGTLVFFTAKALSQYFADYLSLLKSIENEYLISDFRVGTEIHSIPFVLLLFDIVMTGATKVTDKFALLTYLFLH